MRYLVQWRSQGAQHTEDFATEREAVRLTKRLEQRDVKDVTWFVSCTWEAA